MFPAVVATFEKFTTYPAQNLLPLQPRNVNTTLGPLAWPRLAEGRFYTFLKLDLGLY